MLVVVGCSAVNMCLFNLARYVHVLAHTNIGDGILTKGIAIASIHCSFKSDEGNLGVSFAS